MSTEQERLLKSRKEQFAAMVAVLEDTHPAAKLTYEIYHDTAPHTEFQLGLDQCLHDYQSDLKALGKVNPQTYPYGYDWSTRIARTGSMVGRGGALPGTYSDYDLVVLGISPELDDGLVDKVHGYLRDTHTPGDVVYVQLSYSDNDKTHRLAHPIYNLGDLNKLLNLRPLSGLAGQAIENSVTQTEVNRTALYNILCQGEMLRPDLSKDTDRDPLRIKYSDGGQRTIHDISGIALGLMDVQQLKANHMWLATLAERHPVGSLYLQGIITLDQAEGVIKAGFDYVLIRSAMQHHNKGSGKESSVFAINPIDYLNDEVREALSDAAKMQTLLSSDRRAVGIVFDRARDAFLEKSELADVYHQLDAANASEQVDIVNQSTDSKTVIIAAWLAKDSQVLQVCLDKQGDDWLVGLAVAKSPRTTKALIERVKETNDRVWKDGYIVRKANENLKKTPITS